MLESLIIVNVCIAHRMKTERLCVMCDCVRKGDHHVLSCIHLMVRSLHTIVLSALNQKSESVSTLLIVEYNIGTFFFFTFVKP